MSGPVLGLARLVEVGLRAIDVVVGSEREKVPVERRPLRTVLRIDELEVIVECSVYQIDPVGIVAVYGLGPESQG